MSRQLVESIIDKDFVLAESHLNDRLNDIMEKKLYEKKRMVASQMDEMLGGMSRAAAEKKYREKGQEPRRASDVYGDPRDIKIGSKSPAASPSKAKSQQLVRKLTAKAIKFGRKVGGSQFRKGYMDTKSKLSADNAPDETGADLRKTFGAERPEEKNKPGIVKRNINTLMGRKPGYVKPETPEDEKGGRLGKALRVGGKAAFSLF